VTYYKSRVQDIENIRAALKHSDPGTVDLTDIRSTLGYIISDLQVLDSLSRPDSFKISRVSDDGIMMNKIEMTMLLDDEEAEDMVRKLWLRDDT
jgi:hypothetical protein